MSQPATPAAQAAPRDLPLGPGPLPPRAVALAFLGLWTGYGLLYGARDRVWTFLRSDAPMAWSEALKLGVFQSYMAAVLAIVALYMALRFPLERRSWPRNLALHASVGLLAIIATGLLMHSLVPLLTDIPRQSLAQRFVGVFPAWSLIYVMMLAIGHGIDYFRRYRHRQLRASQLEGQLSRARLQALKMQLHPHFLFNTLNSISALMHRDVAAADRMLSRLEDLLRMTLEKSGEQEVRLQEELRVLEPYLEIEQTRYGHRLRVVWDVEPGTLGASVPHLILQPLVENAIKHGIAPRSSVGRIAIVARRSGEQLELEVRDNGAGLAGDATRPPPERPSGAAAAARNGGVGLANTRARLAQLYGGAGHFEIADSPEGGTVARIRVPYRAAEAVA